MMRAAWYAETILERSTSKCGSRSARDGCMYIGDGWSAVIRPPEDGDVEPLVARMRELTATSSGSTTRTTGAADLRRAARRGRAGARRRGDRPRRRGRVDPAAARRRRAAGGRGRVRRSRHDGVRRATVSTCRAGGRRRRVVDGQPVSGGRVDFEPGVEFARTCSAASRCPSTAGAASTARRSRGAPRSRASAGYRWLYVDALPTSRPILERVGFVPLTTTTPFVIPREAR